MVMHGRRLVTVAAVLAAILTGATCKVTNEDHCANQDIPGNDFCLEFSTATPFCSPCRRDLHGCVDFEPFACPGYTNEIGENDDAPASGDASGTDTPMSSGDAPMSTGAASSEASTGAMTTSG